jgi:transcriptional regulator with XRE-family HTH domain
MTVDIFQVPRLITPAELAEFVKTWRRKHMWSQAALAEAAKVDERTIQRVENGEPSNFQTRRALARAFQCDDIDFFNKPMPFPHLETLKGYWAELDKTSVNVPITRIRDARTLRTMSEGANSIAPMELGEPSLEAQKAFASIVDNLQDYNELRHNYSMNQRLDFDRGIDALLNTIVDAGAAIGAGLGHTKARFRSDAPNSEPIDWTTILLVLTPTDALTGYFRLPKCLKF